MSSISNEEIVSVATLQREIDRAGTNRTVRPEDMARFKTALGQFDQADLVTMLLAAKLLERKTYLITSDNPQTISRAKSLAAHMGASMDLIREGNGVTQLRFNPPVTKTPPSLGK
jgi:hypothetical protein